MKRALIAVFLLSFIASTVYADNSIRIQELVDESDRLLKQQTQASQVLQQINTRLVEIRGAAHELQIQDEIERLSKADSLVEALKGDNDAD